MHLFFSHALWSWSVLQGLNEQIQMPIGWEHGFTLDSSSCPSTRTFEACSSASEHVSSVEVEEKKYTRMMKMANLDTITSTTASSWSPLVPKLSQHVWDVEGFANTGGNNENPACLQAFQMRCSSCCYYYVHEPFFLTSSTTINYTNNHSANSPYCSFLLLPHSTVFVVWLF